MYSKDQKKYKSSAKTGVEDELLIPMPLYDEIKTGNVDFLLQSFEQRKNLLQKQIRSGGNKEDFSRWQACIEALDATCAFLIEHKT